MRRHPGSHAARAPVSCAARSPADAFCWSRIERQPGHLGAAVAFWWRQRRARVPLIEPGAFAARPAWGALAVNLALGGALMAVLVNVPLFARATVDPTSEVSAALVLVRFLVAVPIGALLGE